MMTRDLAGLERVLREAGLLLQGSAGSGELTGVSTDSRSLGPGMAYVAVRGSQVDGHRFVAEAVRRGAAALVVEASQGSGLPELIVSDGRLAALAAARAWFGDPASRLTLIGITGTNGKTTTTALTRHLLNREGHAGSIGTLGAFDGSGAAVPSTAGSLTTPGPVDLQATFAALVRRGVTHVAMETSSHSLDQGRLDGLAFAAAIFTNLTRDHLDYHGTMEAYLAAKLRLSAIPRAGGRRVVNADDPAWRAMPPDRPAPRPSARRPPPTSARRSCGWTHGGSSVPPGRARAGPRAVRLPLLGAFNVSNALGAAAAALALRDAARRGRRAARAQRRRCRDGWSGSPARPCVVLRDYAHTPDALERALEALRPLTPGRLIVVFGCGGDRDRGKRPLMGRIAARAADVPVRHLRQPAHRGPRARSSTRSSRGNGGRAAPADQPTARRPSRWRSREAGQGDTVLLAGKGHETYQVDRHREVPFDERDIVRRRC